MAQERARGYTDGWAAAWQELGTHECAGKREISPARLKRLFLGPIGGPAVSGRAVRGRLSRPKSCGPKPTKGG